MSLFVEFHLIQNFAPSNLNRDDTGSPKDAIFGGQRRSRVSSQCQKKAVRDFFKTSNFLSNEDIGIRTRHLDRLLNEELKAVGFEDISKFNEIVKLSLKAKKGKEEDDDEGDKEEKSEALLSYLLFISATEIAAIRELILSNSKDLLALASKKKIKPTDIPDAFRSGLKGCLARSRAVDIALFGRMLADFPSANQHAACQVAHAISTHKVDREFDYFTAVDDKGTADESGAGMIGQVEFNSATLYRYAVLDAQKLFSNLQRDSELTLSAVEAFTQAIVRAIPTGKQNSFAAHNAPAFVGVAIRRSAPLNLANAFEKPVQPRGDQALSSQSVCALAAYEKQLSAMYGDSRDQWAVLDLTGVWPAAQGQGFSTLKDLAEHIRKRVAELLEV